MNFPSQRDSRQLTFLSCSDPSGKEVREENETATAILKKKKKPNQLM